MQNSIDFKSELENTQLKLVWPRKFKIWC